MLKCVHVYVRVVKVLECGDRERGTKNVPYITLFIECEFQISMNGQKRNNRNRMIIG